MIGQHLGKMVAEEDHASFIQHLNHVRGQTSDSPAPERCVLHLIDAHGQRIEVQLESQLVAGLAAATPSSGISARSQAPAEPAVIRIMATSIQDNPGARCPIELASSRLQLQNEIRQREQTERKSSQRQQDLAHVARINTMGEMASGLAHEINQPLTAIASYTQSCLRLLGGDTQQQAQLPNILRQIHIQTQRAANIVKHLRNFVAKGTPHRETTELNSIVRLAVSMVRNEIIHHQIALNIDSHPALPPIEADPVQVEQVILNLLRNAIEAMDAVPAESRRLLITVDSPSPSQVSVSISDTGPGITENDSLQLASAFFSTKETGMGLGLAISRTIIEDHGGQLTHSINADGGATFTFTLNVHGTPTAFNNSAATTPRPDPAVE